MCLVVPGARASQESPFYQQYDPSRPRRVRDPGPLPYTDLTNAFTQE